MSLGQGIVGEQPSLQQGSILQNSFSAESFLDKFSPHVLDKFSPQKSTDTIFSKYLM
jgi:hypothetical protein